MGNSQANRPFVILNAATTLDGKIATKTGDSHISSVRDLSRLHSLRANVDAVMVGVRTVLIDDPILTVRYVKGRDPARIVIDPKARTPLNSRLLRDRAPSTFICITRKADKKRVARLAAGGATIIQCDSKAERLDMGDALRKLKERGIRRILLEGGGTLNWSMLSSGLVDRILILISPVIVGGEKAVTLVEGDGVSKISEGFKLRLHRVNRYGQEVLLDYQAT